MKKRCLILLIVGLLILCGCTQGSTKAPAGSSSLPVDDVMIISHYGYYISGSFPGDFVKIFGEVENIGQYNLKSIKITAGFYNGAGETIRTDWTYVYADILLPGEKSPFTFIEYASADSDYQTYEVGVTSCRETTEEPYQDFEFLNISTYTDDDGGYHVAGELKNTGSQDIDSVEVRATFYDEMGKVVAVSEGYLGFTEGLAAGETEPFDIRTLEEEASPKITSYSLQTRVY